MKLCSKCKEEKSYESFDRVRKPGTGSRGSLGLQSWCKSCSNKQTKQKHIENMQNPEYREKRRLRSLNGKYLYSLGITYQQKLDIIESQNGLCAMCGKEMIVHALDHNHKTGRVRAVLCVKCNTGISYIEDKDFLERAIKYLEKYNANPT